MAVAISVYNDGRLAKDAVESTRGGERFEVVVVDGGSTDLDTHAALAEMEAVGVHVMRPPARISLAAARNLGIELTQAPFIFPLDADDLAVPSALVAMADMLESDPRAAVCFGDYLEFGRQELIRAVPERLDPYRLTIVNEYPGSALFRRSLLDEVAGWRGPVGPSYQDWDLWMTVAERGDLALHAGVGLVTFRRRLEGFRMGAAAKPLHPKLYRDLKARHPTLFAERAANASASDLSRARKLLYPLIYGGRRRFQFEARIKFLLDRVGVWTLRR